MPLARLLRRGVDMTILVKPCLFLVPACGLVAAVRPTRAAAQKKIPVRKLTMRVPGARPEVLNVVSVKQFKVDSATAIHALPGLLDEQPSSGRFPGFFAKIIVSGFNASAPLTGLPSQQRFRFFSLRRASHPGTLRMRLHFARRSATLADLPSTRLSSASRT